MALNKITYDDKTNYQSSALANMYKVSANDMNEIKTVVNAIVDAIYPVGSIYMSVTDDTATKVQNRFGGTWVAWGTGRTPICVDTGQTEFNTVEKTGGEKTHTISINEIPVDVPKFSSSSTGNFHMDYIANSNFSVQQTSQTAMNNLQPYITCYMWKRTA